MRSLIEPLVSNGYTLEMIPERLGWLESTDAGLPVEQLREKYRQNGYLWLKGFFDRDIILDFHRAFFETIFSGAKTFFEIVSSQEYEDHCTGGHYDLIYLRAGTDKFCTSWIPLGDTPVEMGGVIYLEHSDAVGRQMEAEFRVKNANLPPEERISAFNRNM